MDTKKITVFQCSKCERISRDKELTDRCCEIKHCECGKELEPYHTMCEDCAEKRHYERANKIKYSDYKIEMFYDNVSGKFFKEQEDMINYYEDDNVKNIPKWAYACDEICFEIDIDNALECALDEMHEDFDDIVDEKELRDFTEAWNKKQTSKAYYQNVNTVVLF